MRVFLLLALAALGLIGAVPARALSAQDAFVGDGTSGPFVLTWRAITAGTETVEIDSLPQTRGLDYAIDPEAGTITFSRPLLLHAAAAIRYAYDPGHARRNHSGLTLPLSFDLARTEHGSLSLSALYKRDGGDGGDGSASGAPGTLALGVGAGWTGASGMSLTTRFVYAPGLTSGDSQSGSSGTARSGLDVSAQMARWSFGVTRAGVALGAVAGDNNWTAGTQVLTLGRDLALARQVQASVHYVQTDSLDSTAAAGAGRTLSASLQAQPSPQTQVDATCVQGRQDNKTVTAQTLRLALSPQPQLQVTTGVALHENDAGTAVATSLSAQSQPLSFLQIAGGYTSRTAPAADPVPGDRLSSSSAQFTLSPWQTVRLLGSYAQNPGDAETPAQALSERSLTLETHFGALHLTGGCDWTRFGDTPAAGTALKLDLGIRLSPVTSLSGGFDQARTGLGGDSQGQQSFSLNFSHDLGDRFHLSLKGKLKQQTGTAGAPAPDYSAAADVGMKF